MGLMESTGCGESLVIEEWEVFSLEKRHLKGGDYLSSGLFHRRSSLGVYIRGVSVTRRRVLLSDKKKL